MSGIEGMLKEAARALDAKKYSEAQASYEAVLAKQPKNMAANMGMVMVLNRTSRPKEALELLKPIWLKLQNAGGAAQNQTVKATVLAQMGMAQQQLGGFKAALNSFRMANSLTRSDELQSIIAKLSALVDAPQPIDQLIMQAQEQRLSGNAKSAEKLYQAALKLNTDSPDALHGLGLCHRALGDSAKALPYVQQAIILEPDRPDFYNDLGMLFQDRNELKKAITFHKRALSLKSDFIPAIVNLGVAYKRSGQNDQAIEAYQKVISLNPNIAEAYNNLGNLMMTEGELVEARVNFTKALELKPDYPDAKANLAHLDKLAAAAS